MRIALNIEGDLVDDEIIADVSRIVAGVEDGWHDWAHPDPGDARLNRYYEQNPTHRELLEKSHTTVKAYGRPTVRTLTIAVSHTEAATPQGAQTLREAVHLLSQPLEVLVENERNDGRFFLKAWVVVAPRFADRFARIRPAVRFGQGGGKAEIIKLLEHRFQSAAALGSVAPRQFVLLDSDAKYPGHVTSETRQILKVCKKYGVPVHILRKRYIENYIGDAGLQEYASASPTVQDSVDFIVALKMEQRDHFPIKSGFELEEGQPVRLAEGERALYADVAWPVGFRPSLRSLMYHVLEHGTFTKRDLDSRGASQELAELALRIDEEI